MQGLKLFTNIDITAIVVITLQLHTLARVKLAANDFQRSYKLKTKCYTVNGVRKKS